jgi:hypothetical protein
VSDILHHGVSKEGSEKAKEDSKIFMNLVTDGTTDVGR